MFKRIILSTAIITLSFSTQASSWLEAATAVMGARNGAIMDQAEANMERSRLQANTAVARADRAYASNYNHASNQNNGVYSTTYLKGLDCTDLAVEARSFERSLEASQHALNQANNPVSKLAGIASGALSAFTGQSQTVARATEITNAFTGNNNQNNIAASQADADVALANLENIRIYQKAKKCSI
ncbi:MAG TPA: hypothetical protein K8V79_09055 [Acinetobacter lwoffii]|uniref:Uncharacterized protein n=1 Tax=Acinetobacter lwoffii TaxID=28090 RepID=A0A9D2UTC0_ACILW|nr:hypothetical protein [Acinetobacter lwoffii]